MQIISGTNIYNPSSLVKSISFSSMQRSHAGNNFQHPNSELGNIGTMLFFVNLEGLLQRNLASVCLANHTCSWSQTTLGLLWISAIDKDYYLKSSRTKHKTSMSSGWAEW